MDICEKFVWKIKTIGKAIAWNWNNDIDAGCWEDGCVEISMNWSGLYVASIFDNTRDMGFGEIYVGNSLTETIEFGKNYAAEIRDFEEELELRRKGDG